MEQLGAEIDEQLATTPTEELLDLEVLQPENIKDTCMHIRSLKDAMKKE